ncbi:hypothetical protein NG99_04780 [Erwinia typographi]|uniref:Uncharacterized protein n=2 Tax=Erwinia typographi TaxID=371042 RepID=A0A0A3ZBZ9_9GAMM|nr:hypothetical protein NG99_04780 [Erwinia typographi]
MVTRQEDAGTGGKFSMVGKGLIDMDKKEYEYNLYKPRSLIIKHHGLDDIRWPCFEHALYVLNDEILINDNLNH